MSDFNRQGCVALDAGNVDYSAEDCAVPIDDMIKMLEGAKEEGATFVVFLSGNHRGPGYAHAPKHYDWLEDVE